MVNPLPRGPEQNAYDWFAHAIANVATHPEQFTPNRLSELVEGNTVLQKSGPLSIELAEFYASTPASGLVDRRGTVPENVDNLLVAEQVTHQHLANLGWGSEALEFDVATPQAEREERLNRLAELRAGDRTQRQEPQQSEVPVARIGRAETPSLTSTQGEAVADVSSSRVHAMSVAEQAARGPLSPPPGAKPMPRRTDIAAQQGPANRHSPQISRQDDRRLGGPRM